MSEPMATDAAIQVLTERVGNALDDLKEMKGQISAVQQALIVMASMQEKISHVDSKASRLFLIADDTKDQITKLQTDVKHQGWLWKLMGTGLLACLGVLGWASTQYQSFHDLITRVTVLERLMNTGQK